MTLEDASRLVACVPAIVGGLIVLGLIVFLLRAPGNRRRFREFQAQQVAQRQIGAARLGLEDQNADASRTLWEHAVDGAEKVGPFPRFAGPSRVKVLFEGDRNRFAVTVLVERISRGDDPETPDSVTTMVCLASPELDIPAFSLRPVIDMPAIADAVLTAVATVLKPLTSPGALADEKVTFDDRAFEGIYSVRVATPDLAESLSTRDIENVLTPEVRSFFVTLPGWSVEGLNGRFLIYRDDVEESAERMPAFLEEVLAIAERFRSPGA